jgi:hypothetical protein
LTINKKLDIVKSTTKQHNLRRTKTCKNLQRLKKR